MVSHAYHLSAKIVAFLNTKKLNLKFYSAQVDAPLEVGGNILAGV